MTLEEKVGQLLMVHFHGTTGNEEARVLIEERKVGGIIYYNWCNGLDSPEQIQNLSRDLQALTQKNPCPIPLLIAIDQEGGEVTRLEKGFTVFPGNGALGEIFDLDLTEKAALAMGQEMLAVGINMNLAPVVDVNSNLHNPVMGIRSFHSRAEAVLALGKRAVIGYKKAGVIATLKHFPSYGDVGIDPHEALPVLYKSKEKLEKEDLFPFAKLALYADAIMTAHILVPALDENHCATLSEKTLHYLREGMGFQGVIVADSLVMEGVIQTCQTVDEAAIQALQAGCDILILGGKLLSGEKKGMELTLADVERIQRSIIHAVEEGRIAEEKIDKAVERVLFLKQKYCSSAQESSRGALENDVSILDHQRLAANIALLALTWHIHPSFSLASLPGKKMVCFAPNCIKKYVEQTSLLQIEDNRNCCFFSEIDPSVEEKKQALELARQADILLLCSYKAWKYPSQISFFHSLLELDKMTILLATRDPMDAVFFPSASFIMQTFSPSPPSLEAAYQKIRAFLAIEE